MTILTCSIHLYSLPSTPTHPKCTPTYLHPPIKTVHSPSATINTHPHPPRKNVYPPPPTQNILPLTSIHPPSITFSIQPHPPKVYFHPPPSTHKKCAKKYTFTDLDSPLLTHKKRLPTLTHSKYTFLQPYPPTRTHKKRSTHSPRT